MRWRHSHLLRVALLALAAAFVLTNSLAGRWLHGHHVDLTQDRLYTLSPGTLRVLQRLPATVHVTLYFSERASRGLPQLRGYEKRVREMLEEMARNADGKLVFRSADPQPYSEDEDRALSAGLTAVPVGVAGERVLFGLTGHGDADKQAAIPFFQPNREAFLEYDLTKFVHDLARSTPPLIGLVTSLPMQGENEGPNIAPRPWAILSQLRQEFRVRVIEQNGLTRIDPALRVLILAAPRHLDDKGLRAIDDYVMGGGHVLAFVDPDPEQLHGTAAMLAEPPLARLLAAWGVVWDPEQTILDRSRALAISPAIGATPVRHPAVLGLTTAELAPNDVATANLHGVDVSSAGTLELASGSGATLTPLLQSTTDAMRIPVSRLESTPDAAALYRDYQADGSRYVLAARLGGQLTSAFDPDRHVKPEVVVVADSDLLSDRLWVQVTRFFGQELYTPFANNGDLVLNLVDNLVGSDALISIRGHVSVQRPFDRVIALRRDADAHFHDRQRTLQDELGSIDQELLAVQGPRGNRSDAADPVAKARIEQLLKRKLAIRDELREVQRGIDVEIDALGARLELVDVVLVPLGVALLAALLFWWRARWLRRRAHAGASRT